MAKSPKGLVTLLETALSDEILHGLGKAKVKVSDSSEKGATDAYTFRATATLEFFLKVSLDQRESKREWDGFNTVFNASSNELKPHLVRPLIASSDYPFMLYPLLAPFKTMHDWVSGTTSNERKKKLYGQVMETFSAHLWTPSRVNTPPNLKGQYGDRSRKRSEKLADHLGVKAGDYPDLTLRVNGAAAVRIGDLLEDLDNRIAKMRVATSCVIHADEHPRNIVVLPGDKWYVVDYASATAEADWLYAAAKLLHWWRMYYPLHQAQTDKTLATKLQSSCVRPRKRIKGPPLLDLVFDEAAHAASIPSICRQFTTLVLDFVRDTAASLKDRQWKKRLSIAYFAVVFGSVAVPHHLDNLDLVAPAMIRDALTALDDPDFLL